MELTVLGCHGGETPKHRTSSFLLNDRLAIDAGAVTSALTLEEQQRVEAVVVSHSHMDHVRDLATLADNRCQQGGPTIDIVGTAATLAALRDHFFNDVLWPDFTKIAAGDGPTVRLVPIEFGAPQAVAGHEVTAIPVDHTIDSAGFLIRGPGVSVGYSGDTGPTDELWEVLNQEKALSALLMEVSFPTSHAELARLSGHHTPETLREDLKKLRRDELPVLLYHIKPHFQDEVEQELARIEERDLTVLQLGDRFLFR